MDLTAANEYVSESFADGSGFSGGDLICGEDVRAYERIISNRIARMEVRPARRGRFFCRSVTARLGDLRITRIQSDPVVLQRSVRCIGDSQTQYLLGLSVGGRTVIDHSNATNVVNAGDMFLVDKATPFQTDVTEAADRVMLVIPRRILESRLPDTVRYLTVVPSTDSGIGRLAREHIQFLVREGHRLDRSTQMQMTDMCLDLIALTFRSCALGTGDGGRAGGGSGPLLLSRVKAHLKCHIEDPELSPAKAAAAFGLSKRYLHKLFSNGGTAFGAWVREERLMRARSMLTDRRYAHLSITEVAMRQGFNDIPHFSRQFRARFSQTPRDARADAATLGDRKLSA